MQLTRFIVPVMGLAFVAIASGCGTVDQGSLDVDDPASDQRGDAVEVGAGSSDDDADAGNDDESRRPPARCESNQDCPRTGFCRFPDGRCDTIGVCESRPDACPDVWEPVCGCDQRTYGNRCEAARAGVSVAHEGQCRDEPRRCESNQDCPRTGFCRFPDGRCDTIGVCEERPGGCPRIWEPVCGCDERTYGNRCVAASAGVSVAHEGECRPQIPPGEQCGTIQCPSGQVCCNASCGICTDPGDACIQVVCDAER